jgi:hypothetical protein
MSQIVTTITDVPPLRDDDNDLSDVVDWLGRLNAMQLDRVVDYREAPGGLSTRLVSLFFVNPKQACDEIELLLIKEGSSAWDPNQMAGIYTRRRDDSFGYVSFTTGRVWFDSFRCCPLLFELWGAAGRNVCGDTDIANNFALKTGVELLLVRAKKLADKPELQEKMKAVRSALTLVAPHLC